MRRIAASAWWLLACFMLVLPVAAASEVAGAQGDGVELSAGLAELLVLGPMSGDSATSVTALASGRIHRALWWTGGARLTLNPVLPESFVRVTAQPTRCCGWIPSTGIELGVSWRAGHDSGDALLLEAREQSRAGVWPVYLSFYAAPLRFTLFERYRLSALELALGTHVAPFGRFTRVDLCLVSLGLAL